MGIRGQGSSLFSLYIRLNSSLCIPSGLCMIWAAGRFILKKLNFIKIRVGNPNPIPHSEIHNPPNFAQIFGPRIRIRNPQFKLQIRIVNFVELIFFYLKCGRKKTRGVYSENLTLLKGGVKKKKKI